MPITNTNVTVNCLGTGGTATQLTSGLSGNATLPHPVVIYNQGAAPIFVGGASVTPSNGIPVAAGVVYTWPTTLIQGEQLYAIANTATTTITLVRGLS